MQHIANLAEDNSYTHKDQNKFKNWLVSEILGHIPILCSLTVEVLSPAKLLSKTFQIEGIDSMEAQALVSQTKQNLKSLRVATSKILP